MNCDTSVLTAEERLILALRAIYERSGYTKYKMSRFEEYRLYMENKNFLVSESVISFTDLDGRLLALKPDVTLSIVRHAKPDEEQRVYYIENVYRPDKARLNYREIGQLGLERIGKIDIYAIAETAALAAQTLRTVSPDSLLEIGHMGFVCGLIRALAVPAEYTERLLELIGAKNVHGIAALAREAGLTDAASKMLCAVPGLCGSFDEVLSRARELCISPEMNAAAEQLAALAVLAEREGLCRVRLDLSLLGEEDYYNGVIFGGYVDGLPAKVLSGGRYDRVLQKLGKSGGAVGFALYLNELERLYTEQKDCDFDMCVLYDDACSYAGLFDYVESLRAAGYSVYPCRAGTKTAVSAGKTVRFPECLQGKERV